MESRVKGQSAMVQKRWAKARHYCPACSHLQMDPDSAGRKTPPGNHDTQGCPLCSTGMGIYWEDKERNLPKERALRIWKPL